MQTLSRWRRLAREVARNNETRLSPEHALPFILALAATAYALALIR